MYLSVQCQVVHCPCDVCCVPSSHSAGCRTSRVCLQHYAMWWHLMVLQCVAASFHLPSISTANINTMQYTKPYQQYEAPTIPAVVISKVLLPQSNIMANFVHSHRCLLSDVSSGLQTYSNHNVTQYKILFSIVNSCWNFRTLPKMSKSQYITVHFILLMPTDHIFCIRQIIGKTWEYNEVVNQPFTDFKNVYNSFGRENLYNILTQFGILMNAVKLIKCVGMKPTADSGRKTFVWNVSNWEWFKTRRFFIAIAFQLFCRICH